MSEKMSTLIDDLPDVNVQHVQHEQNEQQQEQHQQREQQQQQHYNQERYNDSNITVDIHKKSKDKFDKSYENKDKSYYDILMSYVNKENVLLLFILYIACLRESDEYTRKILLNVPFNLAYNSLATTIIKCVILLILYILLKEI